MSMADKMGFGPTREVKHNPDGSYTITVTANKLFIPNAQPHSVRLNADQYKRYLAWREKGNVFIQDALPELTSSEREILMSGLIDLGFLGDDDN